MLMIELLLTIFIMELKYLKQKAGKYRKHSNKARLQSSIPRDRERKLMQKEKMFQKYRGKKCSEGKIRSKKMFPMFQNSASGVIGAEKNPFLCFQTCCFLYSTFYVSPLPAFSIPLFMFPDLLLLIFHFLCFSISCF